jgi:hypothetical protein
MGSAVALPILQIIKFFYVIAWQINFCRQAMVLSWGGFKPAIAQASILVNLSNFI